MLFKQFFSKYSLIIKSRLLTTDTNQTIHTEENGMAERYSIKTESYATKQS